MTMSLMAAYVAMMAPAKLDTMVQPAVVRIQDTKKEEDDAYAKLIKDYTAQDGVFKVFRNKDSVLYEIPKNLLGRDFLWVTELKATPAGMYNGTASGEGVVRWEEREDKIILRMMDFRARATRGEEIQRAVALSNVNPIIQAFDIKGRNKAGAPLIDVGRYLKNDISEFSVRGAVAGSSQDSSRSFFEKIVAFPTNINVEVMMTFNAGAPNPLAAFFGGPTGAGPKTTVVHHSMVLLPEKPMMPRIKDSRVGYFSVPVQDFGLDTDGSKEYELINRYRLEKKDPNAAVSEVVKPIVYYISPETPKKWRPYIKKAVEDWQGAFEGAGFKSAIICKDAPTEKEDPNWSPEDARYSVLRWAPLPIENAMGPHVHDPRSGEIISAHVILWHDVLKLATDWYFSQASASDRRARRLPFPEELQGELLRFVVAHEVGHTLGLPHNGKSSASVTTAQLRDPKWTAENGTATSIMDYARFNYVAQPTDGAALIPKIGKYDKFSIAWGYTPIPFAKSPWDEKNTLDQWAAKQVNDPQLRFYDNFSSQDPTAQSEALGSNAVEASRLGVLNLKRIMTFLKSASVRLGEDYSNLNRMHDAVTGQFMMYVMHVGAVVGGIENIDWRGGRGGAVFNPVPASYQRSAVDWIINNVMEPPAFLFPKDVMDKFTSDMGVGRMQGIQAQGVGTLLNDSRLNRMIQNEVANGSKAYTVRQLFAQVRTAAWSELANGSQPITFYRRNMQRAWVNGLTRKLANSNEIRAMAMAELELELQIIANAIPRTTDTASKAHLKELRKLIEFSLANPDKTGAAAPAGGARPFFQEGELLGCPLCRGHKG